MAVTFREVADETSWEQCILAYGRTNFFQSWGWGEVTKATGMPLSRIGVYEGKDLVGAMQLARVSARRGKYLHVRHGPVLKNPTRDLWRKVAQYLSDTAKKEGLWFVRISPQIADTPTNNELLRSLGFRPAPIHAMDAEYCWILDLTPSQEELLSGMRKTTRYEVRQAAKVAVKVRVSTDVKDLSAFMSLYEKTAARQGFVGHKGIIEEFAYFAPRGGASLFLGYVAGELRGGALVLFWGDQAIYHHGASIPSREPVSAAVQWEAICEAKRRGKREYNFWGIAPEGAPRHPWSGITLFKKGFGGEARSYLHAQDLPCSPLYVVNWTVETVRKISRGY